MLPLSMIRRLKRHHDHWNKTDWPLWVFKPATKTDFFKFSLFKQGNAQLIW